MMPFSRRMPRALRATDDYPPRYRRDLRFRKHRAQHPPVMLVMHGTGGCVAALGRYPSDLVPFGLSMNLSVEKPHPEFVAKPLSEPCFLAGQLKQRKCQDLRVCLIGS